MVKGTVNLILNGSQLIKSLVLFNVNFYKDVLRIYGAESMGDIFRSSTFKQEKRRYHPFRYSDKDLKGTVGNQGCQYINERSPENTTTVPLKKTYIQWIQWDGDRF